ncbi:MAG: TrkH family potassium uptake protein [Fusobacteriaceae bacterium]
MWLVEYIKQLSTARKLILIFLSATIVGSLLLMLPISRTDDGDISFLTALFTITSAICVTGLSVVDISKVFSPFGQIIIGIFIQLGGLGIMTFSSLLFFIAGKRMTYKERTLLRDERNSDGSEEIVAFIKKIIRTTLIIEGIGAIILTWEFNHFLEYGIIKSIFFGIFHSVSAFCNAGFSLFTDGFLRFVDNPVINFTVSYLIILGGIGFAVINSYILAVRKDIRRFTLTSKLAILVSIILTFGGMIFFFIFEYSNSSTIGNLSFGNKLMASFFQSVTTRTAGFNTVDIFSLREMSVFMIFVLMFIGASPGSTGGGLKTTTFGVLTFYIVSIIRGRENVEIFNRRIDWKILNKAMAILVLAIIFIATIVMLMLSFDDFKLQETMFEVISAFATVGLSLGITEKLNVLSRILIIITMFFGRLGPMTFAFAVGETDRKEKHKYPKENILIG